MTNENDKYGLMIQKLAQKIAEKEAQIVIYEIELESLQEELEEKDAKIESLEKSLLAAAKEISKLQDRLTPVNEGAVVVENE